MESIQQTVLPALAYRHRCLTQAEEATQWVSRAFVTCGLLICERKCVKLRFACNVRTVISRYLNNQARVLIVAFTLSAMRRVLLLAAEIQCG